MNLKACVCGNEELKAESGYYQLTSYVDRQISTSSRLPNFYFDRPSLLTGTKPEEYLDKLVVTGAPWKYEYNFSGQQETPAQAQQQTPTD